MYILQAVTFGSYNVNRENERIIKMKSREKIYSFTRTDNEIWGARGYGLP